MKFFKDFQIGMFPRIFLRSSQLRFKILATSLLLGTFVLAACQPPGAPMKPANSAPTTPRPLSELSNDEKIAMADVLVDELEEMLIPSRFHEAQQKLQEALRHDPNNLRAQFWTKFLEVMVELNGVISRLRPFYASQPGGEERWAKLDRELLPASTDEWRNYLRTPRGEAMTSLNSTEDVRVYLDRVIDRTDVLRQWLKANREREFTLRMPQALIGNTWMTRGSTQRCLSPGMGPLRLVSRNCGPGAMFEAKVNRADLDLMQIWLGSLEFQLVMAQAYVVNPQILIDMPKANEKEFLQVLLNQQSGQLRAQNKLSLFKELTSEALISLRYAMQRQSELCPRGNYHFNNRPGFMLSIGICVDVAPNTPGQRSMAVMESILAGRPVRVEHGDADLEVHALKFFEQPPASIEFLKRARFDACHQMTGFESNDANVLQPYVASGRLESLLRSSERVCRPVAAAELAIPGLSAPQLSAPMATPTPGPVGSPDWQGGAR